MEHFFSVVKMAEGNCVGCNSITKYLCLKCGVFACNRSLDCSIPVSEEYPGWLECKTVALCFKCDKEEYPVDFELPDSTDEGVSQQDETADKEQKEQVMGTSDEHELSIDCASRGFHEYRKIWSPKYGQKLTIKRDKLNLFDPYSIGLFCEIKGKIEKLSLVGHLPREISRFCKFFLEYDGFLDATVRMTKFRRSPLPQGGLEIPIKLCIGKGKASLEVFRKMKGFVLENYLEPEKIPLDIKVEEDEEDDFFVTF